MRDIRKLQQPFASNKNQPAIMVRLYTILLNFDPLRAIILSDRMIVLIPTGADTILDQLASNLHDIYNQNRSGEAIDDDLIETSPQSVGNKHDSQAQLEDSIEANNTFVFKAVESVISVVVNNIEIDVNGLSKKVKQVLRVLETQRSKVSFETLSLLKGLKNDVAGEEARVMMTREAFEEILSEDEDMALLGFSTQRVGLQTRDMPPVGGRRVVPLSLSDCTLVGGSIPTVCVNIDEHEAFEILFENFLQAVVTLQTSVSLLRTEIANGEQFHLLHLTTARNQLLSASVGFSIVSMFTTMGSFVASVFGMNLESGFESSDTAFNMVALTSAAGIISFTLLVFMGLRWSGVLYANTSHS